VKKILLILVGALFVSMAVCQPSEAGAKREATADLSGCVAAVHTWSIGFKHEIASFMGVSLERMPSLFCQRLAAGLRSGRISYSDINNVQLDLPTEIWLVIKGKSKATSKAPAPRTRKVRTCSSVRGDFQIPASQKCPLGGYGLSEVELAIKGKSKPSTQAPPAWTRKFRTCNGTAGSFQVPVSQRCPLSGYARN
jgi:hypothetical protein